MPTPISSFVFKIASRCNLDCTYCYEYNMGDTTWQDMPKFMAVDVAQRAANRILEHCRTHDFRNVDISLHGGEPLAVGRERLAELVQAIRQVLEPHCRLSIGMQTNAVLLDERMLEVIERERVAVGVSLDGPPAVNDKARIYHDGRGSGHQVEAALRLIQTSPSFGGILCVIDASSDPLEVFHYLAGFNPPNLDFLLPHGNWTHRPPLKADDHPIYGEWLATIFDDWLAGAYQATRIRLFEEIIVRLTGNSGSLESIGLEPVALAVVATDGAYEGVDTLKSVYPKAHILGLHVDSHSLDDVLRHPFIAMRQDGLEALSPVCRRCDLVTICGSGYLPHRYSREDGFNNPSVYCQDLEYLIRHIHRAVRALTLSSRSEELRA